MYIILVTSMAETMCWHLSYFGAKRKSPKRFFIRSLIKCDFHGLICGLDGRRSKVVDSSKIRCKQVELAIQSVFRISVHPLSGSIGLISAHLISSPCHRTCIRCISDIEFGFAVQEIPTINHDVIIYDIGPNA